MNNWDDYECDGQMDLFNLYGLKEYKCPKCGHELKRGQQSCPGCYLYKIIWPEGEEPRFRVDIRNIMDDAYCSVCDRILDERPGKDLDCDVCPHCGVRLDWTWYKETLARWAQEENKEGG